MFAYGAGPCRRVDLVTGPGNIYVVTAKRLLKGLVGIDSEAGPTEIAILADDTADAAYVAADLVSQAEHDPLAAAVLVTPSVQLADGGRRRARQAGPRHQAHRADPDRSGRARSRASSSSTTSSRASRSSTPTPPSTSRSRPTTRAAWAARVRNAGAIFVGAHAPGQPRRLLRRLQPRAAHRRLRLPLLGALGARVPAGRCTSSTTAARRWPRSPTTSSPSPRPRTCPATAPPSACGSRTDRGRHDLPPDPGGAARHRALRRPPALDVPVQLNVNENPYGPSPAVVADIATAVARGDGHAEPLPRPRARRAAHARWPATSGTRGHARAGVGGQRLQRGDAAAAPGLRRAGADGGELRADLLDVPRVRPRHPHPLGRRTPRERLQPRPRRGARPCRGGAALGGAAALAQQPDRHGAAARGGRRPVRGRRRRRPASWSTRRTASSAAPARPARSSCCPSTATWSSPAP